MSPPSQLDDNIPVDLSECDREPIHVPGSIQPHGVLLAFAPEDTVIVQVSNNTAQVLGVSPEELLGQRLESLFDAACLPVLREALLQRSFKQVSPLPLHVRGVAFDGILHANDGLLVLELEPRSLFSGDGGYHDVQVDAREAVTRMRVTHSLEELWHVAAQEVKRLTGYDRVMVYRFTPEGHGMVVAEARHEGLEPFLGLHYPASDIPQQARRLYVLNLLRVIGDVDYQPAALTPVLNPLTNRPLDLSLSVLRSVSPVHVQYLRNMGVGATLVSSLLQNEQLWGLIACHHSSPRYVPYRVRAVVEFLSQVLSWLIESREADELSQRRMESSLVQAQLVEAMSQGHGLAQALVLGMPSVLDLVEAGGVAALINGELATRGHTPPLEELHPLIAWLRHSTSSSVFHTDALARHYPRAARFQETCAGVMALALSRAENNFILWFRPEEASTVHWAGNPDKPVQVDGTGTRLSPRGSFALWLEEVRGRSLPWAPWEVEAATSLRGTITSLVLARAAELAQLNEHLREAVKVRDNFLSMASHELRTPLTVLKMQLGALARGTRALESEPLRQDMHRRLEVARSQVGRLEKLISDLLDVSHISAGHLRVTLEMVDLGALVEEVLGRHHEQLARSGCTLHLDIEPGVTGRWDRLRLEQVITHLVNNALKYGRGQPIHVTLQQTPEGGARLTVRDHGVGISPEDQVRIFERFQRAVSDKHFAGFGLGLWLVRQVLQALGGHIRVESMPGHGASFTVELPPRAPEPHYVSTSLEAGDAPSSEPR
jgi:light-regulated signal transduction histidine kinase (bacteriophytochrome)